MADIKVLEDGTKFLIDRRRGSKIALALRLDRYAGSAG
jgi:hypothetical protein